MSNTNPDKRYLINGRVDEKTEAVIRNDIEEQMPKEKDDEDGSK